MKPTAFRLAVQCVRVTIATLGALIVAAVPASAQLSLIGNNPYLGPGPAFGTDAAYDPVNNIYLVVGGGTTDRTLTPVFGVFVNAAGVPVAAPFQINTVLERVHNPRVIYSPHIHGSGGFMIAWYGGLVPSLRLRAVTYPSGPIGSIGSVDSANPEAGPAIAYSRTSRVFLVVWQTPTSTIHGAIFDLNARRIIGPFQVSNNNGGARDPSATWNSHTNEFGVLYTGWDTGGATTTFARIDTSGVVLRNNRFNVASGTFNTDLDFNPNTGNFVGAWLQGRAYGAEINGNGDVVSIGLLSMTTGGRLALAFNPVSRTFLLTGIGPVGKVYMLELNANGARIGTDTEVTVPPLTLSSLLPNVTANSNAPEWNITSRNVLGGMKDQVVRTSSPVGGRPGLIGGCTEPDPFAALGGGSCVNGGWIPGGIPLPGFHPTPTPRPPTCNPPDPFAAIGGGICSDGAWIPWDNSSMPGGACVLGGWMGPGWIWMHCQGFVPGEIPGGCTTPDPFLAIGGGTCIGGGWVPGGDAWGRTGCPPASSPGEGWVCKYGEWFPPGVTPPPPSPVARARTCSTPDPFEALGGGTCIDGGWTFGQVSPPPIPGACATPDPFTAMGGGVCINGGWVPKG